MDRISAVAAGSIAIGVIVLGLKYAAFVLMTAPIASRWSDCRVGLAPLETPPLHAARQKRSFI
jgi:hypothetical protein